MKNQKIKIKLKQFGLALTLTATAALINSLLSMTIGTSFPFFISVGFVTLISWYGGFRAGLFTTAMIAIVNSYIFGLIFQKSISSLFYIQILNFLIEGFLVTLVIEKVYHATKAKEYKQREEAYIHELRKLKATLKKAEEEVRARDEFLSIASHELKTPLTSMLLQLQTILHNIRSVSLANFSVEKLMKMLISAESQTRRLSKMINDLLNVSLITTGKLELELEKADLVLVVKSVIDNFSERLKREDINLNFKSDGEITGQWDKIRIEQAVTNLIVNAIKYGKKKPIDIELRKNGRDAVFKIEDQGIGIAKPLQERIFARFERGVLRHDYEGLGVGLYITNQIVVAHGGRLLVKSREGHGATFQMLLPIK